MTDVLWVSLVGMAVTFVALLLLWFAMAALNRFTAPPPQAAPSAPAGSPVVEAERRARAAAAAVAVALARQGGAHPLKSPPAALVSAWQLGLRTGQMSQRMNHKRIH